MDIYVLNKKNISNKCKNKMEILSDSFNTNKELFIIKLS